ncbi:MAG: hypothetical protein OSA07_06295 [Pseudomonadales bacterium]|jgi:hypothetical protein|nr:hypothetical protein [Pseudomonadales bacterium]
MNMSDSTNMIEPPVGKAMLGTSNIKPNALEKQLINSLDEDKVDDLSKCLFTLNNRRYGPIAGAYVVVCTKADEQWCVGQLNADRAKPVILFEDKVFSNPEEAQKEAEIIKLQRGETTPCRNH